MAKKQPLDFIPAPVPAWKSSFPMVALAAAGVIAWASAHFRGEPASAHDGAEPTLAAAHASIGQLPGSRDAAPGAAAEAQEPAPKADDEAQDPEAKGEPAAADETADETSDAAEQGDAPEDAESPAPPSDEAGEADEDAQDAASTAKPEAKPKPEPEPMSEAELRRAKRAASGLRSALSDGRVQATAEFFALVDRAERAWDGAARECEDASIDGVGHWRLASRGELRKLDRRGVLPAGAYWSRSSSRRDPDLAYAYDAKREKTVLWLKQEPNGAVVCTQARPR